MSKKATKTKAAVPSHAPKPAPKKSPVKVVKPEPEKKAAKPKKLTSEQNAKKLAKNSMYGKMENTPAVPSHAQPQQPTMEQAALTPAENLLPNNPSIGEGRLWDGQKWIKLAPTAHSEVVVWQNEGIRRANAALMYLGDYTNRIADSLKQNVANPVLVDMGQQLQLAREIAAGILDGKYTYGS